MLSASQIKAARALLGWSGKDLAEKSGIGITTLRRYELQDGLLVANKSVLTSLKVCFESGGIEFTGDPLKNPGVTLHLDKTE